MSGQVARAVLLGLADAAAAFLVLMLIVWLVVRALAPSQLAVNEHCPPYAYAVVTPTGPGCATPGHFGFRARGR